MSRSLSENELRILGLVLGEHLGLLRANGLDLEGASPGRLTKERVAMHLRNIGQVQLAQLLSEKRGETVHVVYSISCFKTQLSMYWYISCMKQVPGN